MSQANLPPLSIDELAAEGGTALPDKEVYSLLDLNVDLDLALDLAAPIGLAVAGNANVAAPIDAAVGANVLSDGSTAQALSDQGVAIQQGITGEALANSHQDSAIDQGEEQDPTPPPPAGGSGTDVRAQPADVAGALDGGLLNVDVNLAADLDLAAPINGAVALNANVAAPIDAAVAANLGSVGSEATAVAQQDAIIQQTIDGTAEANAEQRSDIDQ
ncbi:peptidoglycan-binding protein [Actinosynnema sp. NPDC023587]|uniref:peptidoglycan-binding protein n=1 Tax=Actinosynnema sp. NPDC023587 TaxID=3154695 RepID=UPI0033C3B7AE